MGDLRGGIELYSAWILAGKDFIAGSELASCTHGYLSETKAAARGCVCLPGFRPSPAIRGIFGDPQASVMELVRRSKKQPVGAVGGFTGDGTIAASGGCAICPATKNICV